MANLDSNPLANAVRVSLTTDQFPPALVRYIDDNKPDPLSLKQLQGWALEWKEEPKDFLKLDHLPFKPSHFLHGHLEIGGEYLVVSLPIVCAWLSGKNSPKTGQLYYSCHARARFWTQSELQQQQQQHGSSKVPDKIRSKMISRLREDAYISKLLLAKEQEPVLLAQAKISVDDHGGLEERVDVSEDPCEAIKRAVWSQAESPLEMVEILLQFPCLPTTIHNDTMTTTTPLAIRAKLRLLEDAMVDACEQEGEGEMLDDLKISADANTQNNNEDAKKEQNQHKTASKNNYSRKKRRGGH